MFFEFEQVHASHYRLFCKNLLGQHKPIRQCSFAEVVPANYSTYKP